MEKHRYTAPVVKATDMLDEELLSGSLVGSIDANLGFGGIDSEGKLNPLSRMFDVNPLGNIESSLEPKPPVELP